MSVAAPGRLRRTSPVAQPEKLTLRGFFGVFRYSRRAIELVWRTNRPLTVSLAALTVIAGLLPASVFYVGSLIVDAVVAAIQSGGTDTRRVIALVVIEGILGAAIAGAQRGISLCQSLLRVQLGQRINELILEKALTLELRHFEDSEFYDKLTRARREASSRPLRLFRWRSPETRMQTYLETVLAREDHAKEVKLYGLGPRLLQRYRDIFQTLYEEDRALTVRRDAWGFALGLIATLTSYAAYAWIAVSTVRRAITLGQMTMYLSFFRQGQSAVTAILSAVSGMYEDNLYLSTLYEYLETEVPPPAGTVARGPRPEDGVRFENVSFTYPGAETAALENVTLHLKPGTSLALVGENGSGKTTLIKLLTRLYSPTSGRIFLDGEDLASFDERALRERIGVIFQDFTRYQMRVGENVGAGDERYFEDEARWRDAADKGRAS